jgi:hypothetical protein
MKTTKFSKTGGNEPVALFLPMSTTTETEPRAESAAARSEGKALVLFALIKASSKYAYQGRYSGKPVAMQVTHLEAGEYAFHLENGNRYRREDLTFYVEGPDGKLVKLR